MSPLTYHWSADPNLNDDMICGLTPGTYSLTISDAVGNTSMVNFVVEDRDYGIYISDPRPCNANTNYDCLNLAYYSCYIKPFQIEWTVQGGDGTVLSTEETLCGITEGLTYCVTVIDDNGNGITKTDCEFVPLNSIIPFSVNITLNSADCPIANIDDNGTIVSLTDSDGTYTVEWTLNGQTWNPVTDPCTTGGDWCVSVSREEGNDDICANDCYSPSCDFEIKIQTNCRRGLDFGCAKALIDGTCLVSPLTYQWSADPNINNEMICGLSPGSYSLTVTDAVGNASVVSFVVKDRDYSIYISDPRPCNTNTNYDCLNLAYHSCYILPLQIEWTIQGGDGTVLSTEETLCGITEGLTYCVTVIDDNGNGITKTDCEFVPLNSIIPFSVNITFDPAGCPIANVDDDGTIVSLTDSDGTYTVEWTLNGQTWNPVTDPCSSNGNWCVSVSKGQGNNELCANSCKNPNSGSLGGTRSNSANTVNNDGDKRIKISPNPTKGLFLVEIPLVDHVSIEIYSVTGALILVKDKIESEKLSIDLSNQNDGLYLVKFIIDGQVKTRKVIKVQ